MAVCVASHSIFPPASVNSGLANVTQTGGVHGFEFCLVNADGSPLLPPPNVIVVGYYVPFGGINVFSPPCFAVGLNTPLPYSPCITLVSVDILVFSSEAWCFGVAPTTPASIPGHMAYADGSDPGNILIMYPNAGPGTTDFAMACLNSPLCPSYPIPVEGTSWGTFKSLYR
jgi:hypothetical protein